MSQVQQSMQTREVSDIKAMQLRVMLKRVSEGTAKLGEGFYSVKAKGSYMLVDALNADPYVFHSGMRQVHVFVSKPGSGTDHLRQRMMAGIYYDDCVAAEQRDNLIALRGLWQQLGNIPVADGTGAFEADALEEPFLHFPAGTHREAVWHWFEAQHPEFSVASAMQCRLAA